MKEPKKINIKIEIKDGDKYLVKTEGEVDVPEALIGELHMAMEAVAEEYDL